MPDQEAKQKRYQELLATLRAKEAENKALEKRLKDLRQQAEDIEHKKELEQIAHLESELAKL